MRRIPAVLLLCLIAQPVLAGNIYRWVDAQGQVHYGETPPSGVQAESRAAAKTPARSAAAAAPTAPAAPPPAVKPEEKKPVETAEAKAKRCEEAKTRVAFLEEKTAYRLMIREADGSESRMTEEQFQERLGQANKTISEACAK